MDISPSEAFIAAFCLAGSIFLFWTAYRAVATGCHEWRGDKVYRAEDPQIFAIHVGISFSLALVALAGSAIIESLSMIRDLDEIRAPLSLGLEPAFLILIMT